MSEANAIVCRRRKNSISSVCFSTDICTNQKLNNRCVLCEPLVTGSTKAANAAALKAAKEVGSELLPEQRGDANTGIGGVRDLHCCSFRFHPYSWT